MLKAVFFDKETYNNFVESCIRDYQNKEVLEAFGIKYKNRRPYQLASIKKHFIRKKYKAMIREKYPIFYQLKQKTGLMQEHFFLDMVFEEIEKRKKRKYSCNIKYSLIPKVILLVSKEELKLHNYNLKLEAQKECVDEVFLHDGTEINGKIYNIKHVWKNIDINSLL